MKKDRAYKIYRLLVLHFMRECDQATADLLHCHIWPYLHGQLSDLEQCLTLMLEKQEIKQCGIEKAHSPYCGQPLYSLPVLIGEIDPARYQPQEKDAYTEVQEPGVFAIYRFNGKQWGLAARLAQEQTEQAVWVMDFLFKNEREQRYYRPVAGDPDPFEGLWSDE